MLISWLEICGKSTKIFIKARQNVGIQPHFVTDSVFLQTDGCLFAVECLTCPFLWGRQAATGVFYLMSDGAQAGLAQTIFKILLLEFVYNAAAVFVMYAVVKFLYKHFKRRFFIV